MAEDKKTEGLDKEEQKSKAKKMRQDLNGNDLGEMTDDDYDAFKTSSLEYEQSLDGGDGPQPSIDELIAQMVEEGATDEDIIEELKMQFDFSDDEVQALQEPTLSGEPSAFDLAHAKHKESDATEPDEAEYNELEKLAIDAGFALNDNGEYEDEDGGVYTVDMLRKLRDFEPSEESPAEEPTDPSEALLAEIEKLPPDVKARLIANLTGVDEPMNDIAAPPQSVVMDHPDSYEAQLTKPENGNALAKLIGSLKF